MALIVACIVPVSPMRKDASHRSEMVSQLLFGEAAKVLEETKDFIKIRCCYDDYEGWCQRSQLVFDETAAFRQGNQLICPDWINTVVLNGTPVHVSAGTPLTWFHNGVADIGGYALRYSGAVWDASTAVFDEASIKKIAFTFLNTAYLWGGRSVFGLDCSGLVQQVFRFFGKPLPRDAWQQAERGELVGFLQEATCGDLAFFDNEEGRITHTGIMLDTGTIIHASGKVRIDPIDNAGIIHSDTGERTHRLRVIKRYL